MGMPRYQSLPTVPRGYPIGDRISVIVPEATTNLVTNPSVERATTGYTASNGSSIARSATRQAFGVYSLAVTPSSNVNSGEYFSLSLTSGTTYTYSVDVWGAPGVPYRITIADNSANILNRLEFRGEGRWCRYWVNVTASSTATHRLYVEKNNSASTAVFYVDGVQCEAKAYPTTYTDGDMVGFVSTRADFYWTGTPHASTSVRSAQTRAGGRIMRLSHFGFTLMTILGLGLTPYVNVDLPAGFQGGAYFQRSVPERRTFTLMGDMREGSGPALDRRQGSLGDVLRPDLVTPTQPLLLRYQRRDPCSDEPLGDELEIECSLEPGALGNTIDNEHQASESLQFKAYLPVILNALGGGASLGVNTSVSNANRILQRSATGTWGALGTGANVLVVQALLSVDGTLYAGGSFTSMGGVSNTAHIAKWDGSAWAALGSGMSDIVAALAVGPDGALYAGGAFTTAGGVAASRIAKWDGSNWSALGSGTAAGEVTALAIGPDGTLYAGGDFLNMGGVAAADYIAKWDGSAWTALSTGMDGVVSALAIGPDGALYAGGEFTTAGGVSASRIAKWDGSSWSALGAGAIGPVNALSFGPDGTLYAGGSFTTIGGITANRIAAWNGVAWRALGLGVSAAVTALAAGPDGILYAGGAFTTAGGVPVPDAVAAWNGTTWTPLDVDLSGSAVIYAIAMSRDGALTLGYDTSGTATAASVTSVTVGGSQETWARAEFVGPGRLVQLVNETTDQAIYFNLTLLAGERAVLDLRPDRLSFVSTFRGDISHTILPGSDETGWRLQPGANSISVFMTGTAAASEAALSWREAHSSVQSGTP